MRILLIGKMGAGKDTVANYLATKYRFKKFAFADEIKKIARELFPEEFKDGKPRRLLQLLGQKMREIKPDCWANYLMRKIKSVDCQRLVITDCRYVNELEIAQEHGFIPVKITVSDSVRLARLQQRDGKVDENTFDHASETELDNVQIMLQINNDGSFKELYSQVDKLVEEISISEPATTKEAWQRVLNRLGV